jgi:D-3-phosphoglycerate dehydrogenase
MTINVFIALSSFAKHGTYPLDILIKNGFNIKINDSGMRLTSEQIIELAKDANGIIAGVEPYTRNVLESLPKLQCISRAGVGTDNIDYKTANSKKISIQNTPDVIVTPVAELTLAMILSLLRMLIPINNEMKNGKWEKITGSNLENKKVGIIGAGKIGKRVAELIHSFGAEILVCDPVMDVEWAEKLSINYVNIKDIFLNCDIITLHTSKIDDQFLIGHEEIKLFKKGTILINTSRGNAIDESALKFGLDNNILSGIGLDVYQNEPYSGKLASYKNVILTPHVATLTSESRLAMEIQASENLVEFFNKK